MVALAFALLAITSCTQSNANIQSSGSEMIRSSDLRCEYLVNPLGIDVVKPRLSWICKSSQRGQKQTAYRVLVASFQHKLDKDMGDLWDSGKVLSGQSIHVEYAGKPLSARQVCYWKVRTWDKDGKASAWSPSAFWSMGLLEASDWQAKWICPKPDAPDTLGGIKILKAMYVAKDGTTSVDVTEHVVKRVKDGQFNFTVHPKDLGGDPARGHVKELQITYEWEGKRHHAAAEDSATNSL